MLELYKKEDIHNFMVHSMFLHSIDSQPEDDSLVPVLSTENLLLNAYIQNSGAIQSSLLLMHLTG